MSLHCSYFAAGRCRSCALIETPYAAQLAAKDAALRQRFAGYPALIWDDPFPSAARGFRNKAKLVVGGTQDAPTLGIMDEHGAGVDLSDCLLYPPALSACFAPLRAFIGHARLPPYDIQSRRGELKYLLLTLAEASGELMLRFVLRSREALPRISKHLPALQTALPQLRVVSANLQPVPQAVIEGEVEIPLTDEQWLPLPINDRLLFLKPRSFFQTNTAVAAALYRQARAWVDDIDPRSIWDLFCGVGGFALHVTDGRREVLGIELSAEAIAAAERGAAAMGLPGLRFIAQEADAVLDRSATAELVIVNPPRRGIGARLARYLDASDARWVLYSSCNPDSLARDLAQMPGFVPRRARLFDMFAHTSHSELMMLLHRR